MRIPVFCVMDRVYRQVLRYLSEICGLSTRLLDECLRSPLHLACAKGHLAAVAYLLKYQVGLMLHSTVSSADDYDIANCV